MEKAILMIKLKEPKMIQTLSEPPTSFQEDTIELPDVSYFSSEVQNKAAKLTAITTSYGVSLVLALTQLNSSSSSSRFFSFLSA